MTFFGKNTIVRKVVATIKKEPTRYEMLQTNEKETSPLLATMAQPDADVVRIISAAEMCDYTNRVAMFHHMAMRS
ncbi:hypothetical protein M436DRAFT_78081 [Aureobasidium namibiae CBS 147.97]|uniref:Uncharacterized protein n=1 Tax=Aureobasidium namibiae CBS 147.97 TaxID=1043004 RepID=A0A074X894_9PEZI